MYKIGAIGPLPSLERILNIASEFENEIEFVALSYEDAREVTEIIRNHQNEVNGWFFSGPIPYTIAKETLDLEANYVYCPPTGSSLYKSFIQMSFDQQKICNKISIDMLQTEDISLQESLSELEIPTEHVHINTFDENYNSQEIIRFHLQLWREGKTQGVLTCLHSVYVALKQEKVPVYRISMTKMEIRKALEILIERAKTSYFKDTQIGVEIIEIDQFDQFVEKVDARYHLQHLELKIKQTLLSLCEKMDGSLIDNGNGRYQIFSTRGAIERETQVLYNIIQQLSLEIDVSVAVGIGFGETAVSAEINARKAIRHSKTQENSGIVALQDDGLIIESIGKEDELTYHFRSNDKVLLEKLHKANVSIKTYKKIEALVHRMGWDGFTSADLASHLSMTVRNAQRIIGGLYENQLAEYKGEELHSSRGRPRKIYKLKK